MLHDNNFFLALLQLFNFLFVLIQLNFFQKNSKKNDQSANSNEDEKEKNKVVTSRDDQDLSKGNKNLFKKKKKY